jgi:hypothetical protein
MSHGVDDADDPEDDDGEDRKHDDDRHQALKRNSVDEHRQALISECLPTSRP